MSDPFSITVGCIGLVGTIVKVSKTLVVFAKDAQHAQADVDEVSRELNSLMMVLQLLAKNDTTRFPERVSRPISGIVENCKTVVLDVEKCIEKFHQGTAVNKLSWATSGKEEMGKLLRSLEAHKSALELGLDMLNLQLVAGIKDDTSQLLEKIAKLEARLPDLDKDSDSGSTDSNYILQKYLDELTEYTEGELESNATVRSILRRNASPVGSEPRRPYLWSSFHSIGDQSPQGSQRGHLGGSRMSRVPEELSETDFLQGRACKATTAICTLPELRDYLSLRMSDESASSSLGSERGGLSGRSLLIATDLTNVSSSKQLDMPRTARSVDQVVKTLAGYGQAQKESGPPDGPRDITVVCLAIQASISSPESDVLRRVAWPQARSPIGGNELHRFVVVELLLPLGGVRYLAITMQPVQPHAEGHTYQTLLQNLADVLVPTQTIHTSEGFNWELSIKDVKRAWMLEEGGFSVDGFSETRPSEDTEPDVKEEMMQERAGGAPAPAAERVVQPVGVVPTSTAERQPRLQRGRLRIKELKDKFRAEFSTAWRRIVPGRRSAAA